MSLPFWFLLQRLPFAISLLALISLFHSCDHQKTPSAHHLRIGISGDPTTLDPRKMRDLNESTFAHLFYEGLMRIDAQGHPQGALAKEVTISPDLKTYTFHLRDALWSNNDPVTAHDFERTWKSNIDPVTPSPNAYQFFFIKGAKEANEGKLSINQVGIKALDDSTLVVELTQPTPYFLRLVAAYFSLPVNEKGTNIYNGPFVLKNWTVLNEVNVEKNPLYWDKDKVKLNNISFIVADDSTALRMYEKGELDWIGSPLGIMPPDAIPAIKNRPDFFSFPAMATYFINFNTSLPIFEDAKTRQAFRDTLRRNELTEHVLQGNQTPAYSLVPFSFSQPQFEEKDTNLSINTPITLSYASNERNHKIAQAVQEQWRKHLGINIQLQSYESKLFLEKRRNRDFQLAVGSWFADFSDPISFLEVFKDKDNGTNSTGWENSQYQNLLNQSASEQDPKKRAELLKQAEKVLIEESPIITLFHNTYNSLHHLGITGICFSDLGYLDFKNTDIE